MGLHAWVVVSLACASAELPQAALKEGTTVNYDGRPAVIERQHHSGAYKLRFLDGQEPRKAEQISSDDLALVEEADSTDDVPDPTSDARSTKLPQMLSQEPQNAYEAYGVVSDDQHAMQRQAASPRLVRRSVDAQGEVPVNPSNPFADPSTHDTPHGGDAELCARLAESELGVQWAKKLGGGGSGGVVFATTGGTVVKCGKGENMKKEGDVLSNFRGVDGVVQIYQMAGPVEGMYLVHMELLQALEWKMCFLESACDCEGPGCFPSCRKRHGHGDKMFASPLSYREVQQLIKGHVEANLGSCQAGWSQMDGSSGMNAMVTDAHAVKLIDFEQGQPLGAWGSSPWCNHDQNFMPKRIEEAVRCLPADDAFRRGAEEIGAELGSWQAAGPAKCGGQCHLLEARQSTGAIEHDIADATEKAAAVLRKLDALPTP